MSGGSWDYLCYKIDDAADRLSDSKDTTRKAFAKHLYLVAKALHDIEWVDSDDMSKGDEYKAIRKVISREDELAAVLEDAKDIYEKLDKLLEGLE